MGRKDALSSGDEHHHGAQRVEDSSEKHQEEHHHHRVRHTQPAAPPGSLWRATLLGWPMLFGIIAYFVWFCYGLYSLVGTPMVRGESSSIDHRWASLLQPAMFIPTIVVFSYFNWLGWKFFQHN